MKNIMGGGVYGGREMRRQIWEESKREVNRGGTGNGKKGKEKG